MLGCTIAVPASLLVFTDAQQQEAAKDQTAGRPAGGELPRSM
jgi:hypothetical protein